MERRTFLLTSAGVLQAQTPPADRVSVGLIGSGGRGRYILSLMKKDPAVQPAAVCDVYEPNLEAGLSEAKGAKAYRNYKKLLEDKNVDAVIIATPEHWHHRMMLDAIAAGKDIYIEKPLCQTPEQGVELVAAAKQSRSVIQVGTQRRSYDLYIKAREIVSKGTLGDVRMVRSWWLNNMLEPPRGTLKGPLDWEQWQGPAERRPMDPARFFHWRFYSDYSGGVAADQGAHVFDGITMLMGATYPVGVTASANKTQRPGVDTPETMVVAAEYPEEFLAVFSINYAAMRYKPVNDQLNQFDGNKARLDIGREHYAVYNLGAEDQPVLRETSGGMSKASEDHVRNFLECVRTRATPNATVESGFQAVLVLQMANLSLRKGTRVRWNRAQMKIES
jgi:predicted dehydrogenase